MTQNPRKVTNSRNELPISFVDENLQFEDIMEKYTKSLRSLMSEFLQVLPYHIFEAEFSAFLKRLKNIIVKSRQDKANKTQLKNIPLNALMCLNKSTSHNKASGLDIRKMKSLENSLKNLNNSTSGSSTSGSPTRHQNASGLDRRKMENVCSSKLPIFNKDKQKKAFPHIDRSNATSYRRTNIDKKNIVEKTKMSISKKNDQSSKQLEKCLSTVPTLNSSISGIENSSAHSLDQYGCSDTTESLLEDNIKYLSNWFLNLEKRICNPPQSDTTEFFLKLTGTLLSKDQVTELEKHYNAGILENLKGKKLAQTSNGLYHLIGPIGGGFSKAFYEACLKTNGIPKTWKRFLTQITSVKHTDIVENNINSINTRDTMMNESEILEGQQSDKKDRHIEQCIALNSNSEFSEVQNLSPLIASTSKKQFKNLKHCTPSQYLKLKFHQKMVLSLKIANNLMQNKNALQAGTNTKHQNSSNTK